MGTNIFNDDECDCRKPKKKHCCGEYILSVLLIALSVTLGLIIGANLATSIVEATSALIILAVMLGILVVIRIISLFCRII